MKKKIIADPLLMIVTILIIVGFQVYWLKNNYDREARLLASKAGIVFRSSVFELQAKKLRLSDSSKNHKEHTDIKLVMKDGSSGSPVVIKRLKEQLLGITDAMRRQMNDSLLKKDTGKTRVMISMNNSMMFYNNDTVKTSVSATASGDKERVVQILYGIDSLQDTIPRSEIIAAVQRSFKEEKLPVSFSLQPVAEKISIVPDHEEEISLDNLDKVTIGFAHPVTYKLQLENTFGYLFKKILPPLLFSLFLVAVTIFTFLLLYRNLNRQRRLTDIKNEFIGNITHELKTPISTVSVAIEAMQRFNALQNPARTQEYLNIANNELQRLGLLVDKVLKLSMFEKQEVELQREVFDIEQLVKEVVSSMRLQFEKYHAAVEIQTEGSDFTITADRMHITSVVYNLLDNALKYSSDNPRVDISIAASAEKIVLKVADNGVGIPAAYKDKIFDKFFRVPSGDRHNVKGYGLGLSYVAHIIAQHNGTIEVKSDETKGASGTQFTIQLPKQHEDH
ncbi:sensor histidine kinase [Ferruginibacter sp.]